MRGFARSLAFLVAIDRYQNGVPELRTPVADAEELAKVLHQDQGFVTTVIANESATLAGLRTLLADLVEQVGNDDRLIFYFAGHGVAVESDDGPKGFILPQDARKGTQSEESFLPMVELDASLSKLNCRHMLVILDCCFAGAFRWASFRHLALATENLHKERYEWFIQDAAWQAIASAAQDQKALDVAAERPLGKREDDREHSPFAAALIRGLRGQADRAAVGGIGDGVITATELYLYLEEELLPKRGGGFRQTPIFWPLKNHDKGQFVFLVGGQEPSLLPAPPLDADANPWRGLKSYEARHEKLFFGRRNISDLLAEKLLGTDASESRPAVPPAQLIVVTGPSGIGKSSLVRAGLLPRLDEKLLNSIVLRPGPAPFADLAGNLRSATPASDNVPDEVALRQDQDSLAIWVRAQSKKCKVLLIVDQAEELITMSPDEGVAVRYLALLANAIDQCEECLHVVFTVRSEFEPQFAQSPLEDRWSAARFLVPPMTQDELRRVIEGPAAVKVMRFEPPKLIEDLVNEVVQMPGALPLLSFALSLMYANYLKRRGKDRALTYADYQALEGGVTGSLRVRANEIVGMWNEPHEITARRVLKRLMSANPSLPSGYRTVALEEFDVEDPIENARTARIVSGMEDASLVVRQQKNGLSFLEFSQNVALLGSSDLVDRVKQAFDLNEETARRVLERFVSVDVGEFTRRRVPRLEFKATDPTEQARVDNILKRLIEARLVVTDKIDNKPYLELAHDALISGWDRLFAWVRHDAVLIADLRRLTRDAQRWAVSPKQEAGLLWSDPARLEALKRLQEARSPGLNKAETTFADASTQRASRNRLIRQLTIATLVLLSIGASWLAKIADDRRALAEFRARETKSQQLAAEAHLRNVSEIGVPEEALIIAINSLSTRYSPQGFDAWLESLRFLPKIAKTTTGKAPVTLVQFVDSGHAMLSARDDGTVTLTDLAIDKVTRVFSHSEPIVSVYFCKATARLLIVGDFKISVWDVEKVSLLDTIEFKEKIVSSAVGDDGQQVAIGRSNGYVAVIRTDVPSKYWEAKVASTPVSLDFTGDGGRLAVAIGNDSDKLGLARSEIPALRGIRSVFENTQSQICVLDLAKHTVDRTIEVQAAPTIVKWNDDGQSLAVGLINGAVLIFRYADLSKIGEVIERPRVVHTIRFLSNDLVAVASESGVIVIWSLSANRALQTLPHNGLVQSLDIDKKRQRVVSISADGVAHGWDLTASSALTSQRPPAERFRFKGRGGIRSVTLDPESGQVALGDLSGNLYLVSFEPEPSFDVMTSTLGGVNNALAYGATQNIAAYSTNVFNGMIDWASGQNRASWISSLGSNEHTFSGGMSLDIDTSADGKYVVTANGDGVYLRSTDAVDAPQRLGANRKITDWTSSRFQGGALRIVGAGAHAVAAWRLQPDRPDVPYELAFEYESTDTINALVTSPARAVFVTGGETLLVRSAIDGKVLRTLNLGETVTALAIDATGRLLVAGTSSGRVMLLRPPNWRVVQEVGRHEDAVIGLAISDDGEFIASTSGTLKGATVAQRDQSLRLWDASEHRELFRLPISTPGAPVRFDRDRRLGLLDNGKLLRIDWSVSGLKNRTCKYVQQDLSLELRSQLELPAATCPGANSGTPR